jgi:hypothetical protein
MPWEETCPMDERMQFVADYLEDQWPVAQLCRRTGSVDKLAISESTARRRRAGWEWASTAVRRIRTRA